MGRTPACLLTPVAGAAGYYTANAGTLQLTLTSTGGTVEFDATNSSVLDITNIAAPTSATCTTGATTFSFVMAAGKTYHVDLVCNLLPSPYTATGTLDEACGKNNIDTVNLLNQAPGFVVTVNSLAAAPGGGK